VAKTHHNLKLAMVQLLVHPNVEVVQQGPNKAMMVRKPRKDATALLKRTQMEETPFDVLLFCVAIY